MLLALRCLLVIVPVCLLGCPAPWDPLVGCAQFDACGTTEPATTSDEGSPTTGDTKDGINTVTGDSSSGNTTTAPDAESGADTTGTTDTTGEAPAEPPAILNIQVDPAPPDALKTNGSLAVTAWTEHTDHVDMQVHTGDVISLTESDEPGVFVGEIPACTGLWNGQWLATLTPSLRDVVGEPMDAPYWIDLPTPGSEQFWETGDLIGPGKVVAMVTLPTGEIIELGPYAPAGEPRCYLRKRDPNGQWALKDVLDVLPDTDCEAIDLARDDAGALHVLVRQYNNGEPRWRLLTVSDWEDGVQQRALGAKDEDAVAVALHPSGTIGVCGTAPTGQNDEIDAAAWLFPPNLPAEPWAVDYRPPPKLPHLFAEHTRDCVFVSDMLALVGEARGEHAMENKPRDRLFILRLDTATKTSSWFVAEPGDKLQSGAQAVAVDGQGRLVTGGFTCDDTCTPVGDLRVYDDQNTLVWQASLGKFMSKPYAIQDLVWSPAGYAVVATGGLPGDEDAFTVRAFNTSQVEALWTYTHNDLMINFAFALATGTCGVVHAGGLGANGYPAVARVAG